MSVPSIEFICEKCSHTGSTGLLHGPMMYRHSDKEHDVNRCLGWCHDCDGFASIEDFSDTDELLKKLVKVTDELQYLYGKRIALFLASGARFRRDSLLDCLSETSFRLDLVRKRKGEEKCLRCGCSDVVPFDGSFPRVEFYHHCPEPSATGFRHPGCGGEFIASISPIRFNLIFESQLFSIDGDRLDY